jgi:hypothetical protein
MKSRKVVDVGEKIAFLRGREAEAMRHSSSTLLEHLLGTRQLLVAWSCRETVCDAGLFHSVYGTESYSLSAVPLSDRAQVRSLIGREAERLAFLFCVMEKGSFYANLPHKPYLAIVSRISGMTVRLTVEEFGDLCHMAVANWLEQHPRVAAPYRLMRRPEFSAMRPWLVPAAWAALNNVYDFGNDGSEVVV